MGSQFSIGSGTFGTTGFFAGLPGTPNCPPMGGGGGTGIPIIRTAAFQKFLYCGMGMKMQFLLEGQS